MKDSRDGGSLSGGRSLSDRPTTYDLRPTRFPLLVILLSSLLWALSYPPFPLGALAFAVLAPAFYATTALMPGRAFRLWFVSGLVYNTAMYWWIWNVMKVGPALAVGAGLVFLIAFLSLFSGLLGWGFARAWHAPPRLRGALLATYPLAWAGLEAARAVGEMSFPWNNLAYTLGDHPALIQSTSVWGSYGLSAAMIAANLALTVAFLRAKLPGGAPGGPRSHPQNRSLKTRILHALPALLMFASVPLLLALHGTLRLRAADDREAPRLDISLVQPSIPQTKKWNEEYFSEVIRKTFRVMEGPDGDFAPVRGSELIVWAETAVPDFLRTRPQLDDSLRTVAAQLGAPLLVGALDIVVDRTPWSDYRFYNSAFLYEPPVRGEAKAGTPSTQAPGHGLRMNETLPQPLQYSKLRLVPFSEKLPFDGVFPVLNYVNLGEGDFSPGDGHRHWGEPHTRWSPSICYEVIYPSFARQARAGGAKLLVNITNDGWFGRSNGPYQHANISRFRAVETGMPVARCANNGVSVFFDAWGRDLGRTALMDSVVLRRTIAMPDLAAPYARTGDAVDGFFLMALPAWALVALFSRGLPRFGARTRTSTLRS
jgi:apolipoprotein N-acyltransferase